MICHGDCGHPCQLPSHGSMDHHPHTELIQLTLWENLKILVRYHCHFFFASVLARYDGHHHDLALEAFNPLLA